MAANVAIRFSVENAETVRQALQALGKDGEKALQQLSAASAQPNRGLNALSSLVESAKSHVTGLAFSIGPAGQALVQLGPVGLVAAAALGSIAGALSSASESAARFAEWARKVRESAETIGVTTDQLQGLAQVGQRVGVDFDKMTGFLDKLTLSVEELRNGGGKLFDTLAKIDMGLAREVASARSTSEAIDLVARAYTRLNDVGQRNALVAAVGGRGNLDAGRLLAGIAGAGGTDAATERARQAQRVANAEQLSSVENVAREIKKAREESDRIWDRLWTPAALSAQRTWANVWLEVAKSAETINAMSRSSSGEELGRIGDAGNFALMPQNGRNGRRAPLPTVGDMFGNTGLAPGAPAAPSAAFQLGEMRKWTSVLGEALTPSEQLAQRILELNAAQADGAINDGQRARALGAFTRAQEIAAAGARNKIGVLTEEQALSARMAELDDLQTKGFIKNSEERAQAERLVRREVKETTDALAVRNSTTPGLTRLAIDANDLTKSLDQGLTGALRGSTTAILDMVKGTKSLSDGFSELATRILDAVTEALILKSIVGPLSSGISAGISSAFAVTPSAFGNVFAGGRLTAFSRGAVVSNPTFFPMANGGTGIMSENEPEAIMPLRRLGSGRLGVEATGAGSNVQVNIINNHPNARIQQREENDGRGGRRTQILIEEAVAAAVSRPGSSVPRAFAASGAMTRL